MRNLFLVNSTAPAKLFQRSFSILVVMFVGFALVEAVVVWAGIPTYVVPLPSAVARIYVTDGTLLWTHFLHTMSHWVWGILSGVFLGLVGSFCAFFWPRFGAVVRRVVVLLQTVPYVVFSPLLVMWFGLGGLPKIILVFLTCSFPVFVTAAQGLEEAQKTYGILTRLLRLSPFQALWHIYAPAALPAAIAGLRMSAAYAFVGAVMAEWIGSESGLGVYMTRAQTSYRLDKVMAAVGIIVLTSFAALGVVDMMAKGADFFLYRRSGARKQSNKTSIEVKQ